MSELPFKHFHSAHCESGVTASLISHHGYALSEPMAFGIAAGLFFIHLPIKTLFGAPNTNFRSAPGNIFRKTCRRLGVQFEIRTFRDVDRGTRELDQLVASGIPVGVQSNVFWLSHMPKRFRFQFNAHNLVVFGKGEEGWRVSDPVLEVPVNCTESSMARARFAKGFLAPKGKLYFVTGTPVVDPARLRHAVREGIIDNAKTMARIPVPFFGGKAIGLLADRMEKWPRIYKDPQDSLMQLSNVVRMQEEIGTGGAGFRYLYAAFLQESAAVLDDPRYLEFSEKLTEIGDTWRQFAAKCARICRSQKAELGPFGEAAALVRDCGVRERALFGEILEHELRKARPMAVLPAGEKGTGYF
jgi:hypothetical protein